MNLRSTFAKSALAGVAGVMALGGALSVPTFASAQSAGYYGDSYYDPCRRDSTNRGTVGALIGGALGAVFGGLAGTFFAFGQDVPGGAGQCRAIIDDLQKKEQYLVVEGDAVDGVEIARIFTDHVVARSQGRDEELWLSFSGESDSSAAAAAAPAAKTAGSSEDAPALEVNRFGKRVGETQT